jgi:hypothetical protein
MQSRFDGLVWGVGMDENNTNPSMWAFIYPALFTV